MPLKIHEMMVCLETNFIGTEAFTSCEHWETPTLDIMWSLQPHKDEVRIFEFTHPVTSWTGFVDYNIRLADGPPG